MQRCFGSEDKLYRRLTAGKNPVKLVTVIAIASNDSLEKKFAKDLCIVMKNLKSKLSLQKVIRSTEKNRSPTLLKRLARELFSLK